MGRRDRRRHVEGPDFEDDKVAETSTIQGPYALLKQIRSLPGAARAAWPARRPEAAGCRRAARTCDGGAESRMPRRQVGGGHAMTGYARGGHQCGLSSLILRRGESFRR
jgi:hypothetical protein